MKYFETLLEDQETTISILYAEQMVKIYSSEPNTIQKITKAIGKPVMQYKKSKTYWSGASWEVNFFELDKLKVILNRDTFIDKKVKPIVKKEKKLKNEKKQLKTKETIVKNNKKTKSKFEQIEFDFFDM